MRREELMGAKKKKVRVEFRRNRTKPPRGNDLTRQFQDVHGAAALAGVGHDGNEA